MSGPTVVLDLRSEITSTRDLLRDLWVHRDLLPMLARQHFRGQYQAARLGVAWAAAQPLLRGTVIAVIFSQIVRFETVTVPYPAFVFAGIVTFQYIAAVVSTGATAIAGSSDLAGRVYFPRLLLAAMPASSALLGYLVGLVLVIALTFGFGVDPSWTLLALPAAIALAYALVVAASACLALLHVYWRDVGPLVNAVVSIGFYLTPIIYPITELPEQYRIILEVNPATGAIGAVRWSLFGGSEPGLARPLAITLAWTVGLLVIAVWAYRRHDRNCVDRL